MYLSPSYKLHLSLQRALKLCCVEVVHDAPVEPAVNCELLSVLRSRVTKSGLCLGQRRPFYNVCGLLIYHCSVQLTYPGIGLLVPAIINWSMLLGAHSQMPSSVNENIALCKLLVVVMKGHHNFVRMHLDSEEGTNSLAFI